MVESFPELVREFAIRIGESGPSALSGLFDLTSHRLHRYAVTITRNQHDAEDVVQAILVKVAAKPDYLANSMNPWHYLLQMVRNQALTIVRDRRRATFVFNLSDLLTRRRVDEVELEEVHRAVWLALRKLPAEQSEVVVLKLWEELTFVQIGELLVETPSTVASRYRYAISKLSRLLQKTSEEMHQDG